MGIKRGKTKTEGIKKVSKGPGCPKEWPEWNWPTPPREEKVT